MRNFIFIILCTLSNLVWGQDVLMQNGTVNQCGGVFYDSGGEFGNYGDDESFILTICPENPGQRVQLDFTEFSTQLNVDTMIIYNGDSTAEPAFGMFTGGNSPGLVQATSANATGCITIEFTSNGSGNTGGWAADISCLTPCQVINSQLDSAVPAPNGDGYIRVCPNEDITLSGSGTFSVDGTGATYEWDLGDGNTAAGQTVTFSYTDPGVYIVNLNIRDTNTSEDPLGCTNNNLINQVVQVATEPDFTGTQVTNPVICFGESTDITGVVQPTDFINDCTPPVADTTFLPDGNGVSYTSSIPVDCFDSAATITDPLQIVSICLNIEHSFLGDLEITIISPNGQQAILKDFPGGGGTYLGGANDDGSNTPGVGADYCFSMTGTQTLVNGQTIIAGTPAGPSIVPGTYLPEQSFANLVGSPLNGDWTIEVTDNLGIDNGYIFSWEIEFDPNLQPPELSFTPVITSEAWDADTTITNTNGNVITVSPPDAGQYCYTYRVTDDFGCEYTEEVCIDVLPEIITTAPNDLVVCDAGSPPYIFNLDSNTNVVLADAPNPGDLIVTYHNTPADAEAGIAPITGTGAYSGTDGELIYVRIEYQTSGCYEVLPFSLVVTGQPAINTVGDLVLCDDPSNDGVEEFDLSIQTPGILGAQSSTAFNVTYHLSFADADAGTGILPTLYTNSTSPQEIYVRIESVSDANCYNALATPVFNLVVSPRDDAAFSIDPTCDGATITITGDLGGTFSFDVAPTDGALIDANTGEITNASPDTSYSVSYTTNGTCASSEVVTFDTLSLDDVSFSVTPTCDGGVVTVTGVTGGSFSFNTPPIDGAVIDVNTGEVTNATPGESYEIQYSTSGSCANSNVEQFTVNSLPSINAPTPLEVCDDGVADGITEMDLSLKDTEITGGNPDYSVSYHETPGDADLGQDALPVPYTNTVNNQLVYVRVEDTVTGCYDTTVLELIVQQAPVAFAPQPLLYCDPDSDGFGVFDLTSADAEITGGDAALEVSYHETQANAENGVDAIVPATSYANITEGVQTLYARVENPNIATDCAVVVELELIVEPTPQIADPLPLEACDDATPDGLLAFDLTVVAAEVLNGLDPFRYVLSYYATEADADAAASAIANPFSYVNTVPGGQTVWIRVEDTATAGGCYKLTSLELVVNPLPVAQQPLPLELCDDLGEVPGDELTVFDLTVKDPEITGGNGSWSVAYYETLAGAQSQTGAIGDPTTYTNTSVGGLPANPQTLYAVVTDTGTGCTDRVTLTIRVLPNPTPTPSDQLPDLELCDEVNTGDGVEQFDLTQNELLLLNGETGVTVTYHETAGDAGSGTNAILDPTVYTNAGLPDQTIYVRVTSDATGCYALVDFDIRVDPLPEVVAVTDFVQCELNTDGFAGFDLTSKDAEVLGGQDPTAYTVSYHATLADAESLSNALLSPYTNTVNPQEIYVAITDNATGCSIATQRFDLEVQEAARANPDTVPITYGLCDDEMELDGDPTDDSVQFDLGALDAEVLDGQDPTGYTVSYYATEQDALLGVSPLPGLYENVTNPQVIYARVDNDIPDGTGQDSSICFDVAPLTLRVDPLPGFVLEESYTLCVGADGSEAIGPPLVDTGLSAADYTFEWTYEGAVLAGETGPSLAPLQGGSYGVTVTDVVTGCTSAGVTVVVESGPPTIVVELVSEAFSGSNVVRAEATGTGVYEYSLDGGPWQESGTFVGVSPGLHVVTARDVLGCGQASGEVVVLDYPRFFTPNGDGNNDTWNIVGIDGQSSAKIYIFDRYGKLLKQLSPMGSGWDGTFNGSMMPSSDYWFTLTYNEPLTGARKEFRAHFTLKH